MTPWTWVSYIWTHPANRGRRVHALMRALAYQLRTRLTKQPIITPLGDARVWVHLHETGVSRAVYGNPPDFAEMVCWKRLLRPGDLFVDVGANAGVYSVWAAAHGAQVIAIEPNPRAADRLRDNARLNGFCFEIHTKAISASSGPGRFSTAGDVLGHLEKDGDLEVETISLDELLGGRQVRGIKVDVEGYERLVLEGARRSLSGGLIDYLQLEWNIVSLASMGEDRSPVVAILGDHGYTLAKPDDTGTLRPATDVDLAQGRDLFAVRPGL